MSENGFREKCAVCSAYLFEEDDKVYCPECGAPHHRECYKSIGHCGMAELHNTDRSYDRVKATMEKEAQIIAVEPPPSDVIPENFTAGKTKCSMCSEYYDSEKRHCTNCGAPNLSHISGYEGFDFLGGVPADMDIGEGVTADEAKRFVISNTHRYIPKFAKMANGSKASWNWFAFFFPGVWYFSRKMYKNGVIVSLLSIIFTLFTLPLSRAMSYIDIAVDTAERTSYFDYANRLATTMLENIDTIGVAVIVVAYLGFMLSLALSIIVAILGDYTYRNHTIEKVKELKSQSLDIDSDYRRFGGISILATMLSFFAVQYLPSIIMAFLV